MKNTRVHLPRLSEDTVFSASMFPSFYVVKYKNEKYIGESDDWAGSLGALVDDLEDAKTFSSIEEAQEAIDEYSSENLFITHELSDSEMQDLIDAEIADYGDEYEDEPKKSSGLIDEYPAIQMIKDKFEVKPIYASQFRESSKKNSKKYRENFEFDYSGWNEKDAELHKKIDWEARNYQEFIVPGTEYEGSTHFYSDDGLKIVKEIYAKRLRPNPNYPPYYGPIDNTSTKKWTSAMYDGRSKDGYHVHDRRESWEVYRALSEKTSRMKEEIILTPEQKEDLYKIADRYCTSKPVSGSWDTETEHELKAICKEMNFGRESAKEIMKRYLGFTDRMFDDGKEINLSEEEQDLLWDIANRYCTSVPVSGSWEKETEHEINTIMSTFGISRKQAIQCMKKYLGWTDEDLRYNHVKLGESKLREAGEKQMKESTWTVEVYDPRTNKTIEKKSGFGSDYAACEYGDHTLEDLKEQGIEADYDTFQEAKMREADSDYIKIGNRVYPNTAEDFGNTSTEKVLADTKKAYDQEQEEKAAAIRKAELEKKAEVVLNEIKVDWDSEEDKLEVLFNHLVPRSGKAETVAGELVRAMMKILYRDYNDGDIFYDGYGKETCGAAAAFICEKLDDFEGDFIDIVEKDLKEDDYTRALNKISAELVDYIMNNTYLLAEENTEDMYDYDEDYFDDYVQKYSYDPDLSGDLEAYIDHDKIDWSDVADFLSNFLSDLNIDYRNLNQWARDAFTIEDLSASELEEVERKFPDYLDSYLSDLENEYGSVWELDEEEEEEEEEDLEESQSFLLNHKQDIEDFLKFETVPRTLSKMGEGEYLYGSHYFNHTNYGVTATLYQGKIRICVKSYHPYDDADYHWALCKDFINHPDEWLIILAQNTPKKEIIDSFRELIKILEQADIETNIQPKMMHEKYLDDLPSTNHVEYVLDNVLNWDRGWDFDKRSLKQIARACKRYDNSYTAEEYLKVIKDNDLLERPTKNSIYRTINESNPITNKLSLTLNDFLMDMAQGYVKGLGYKEIMNHNYSKEDIAALNALRKKCEAEDGDEGFIKKKVVPEIKKIFGLSKKFTESKLTGESLPGSEPNPEDYEPTYEGYLKYCRDTNGEPYSKEEWTKITGLTESADKEEEENQENYSLFIFKNESDYRDFENLRGFTDYSTEDSCYVTFYANSDEVALAECRNTPSKREVAVLCKRYDYNNHKPIYIKYENSKEWKDLRKASLKENFLDKTYRYSVILQGSEKELSDYEGVLDRGLACPDVAYEDYYFTFDDSTHLRVSFKKVEDAKKFMGDLKDSAWDFSYKTKNFKMNEAKRIPSRKKSLKETKTEDLPYLVTVKDITEGVSELDSFFDCLPDILQDERIYPDWVQYEYSSPSSFKVGFRSKEAAERFYKNINRDLFEVHFYNKITK